MIAESSGSLDVIGYLKKARIFEFFLELKMC